MPVVGGQKDVSAPDAGTSAARGNREELWRWWYSVNGPDDGGGGDDWVDLMGIGDVVAAAVDMLGAGSPCRVLLHGREVAAGVLLSAQKASSGRCSSNITEGKRPGPCSPSSSNSDQAALTRT